MLKTTSLVETQKLELYAEHWAPGTCAAGLPPLPASTPPSLLLPSCSTLPLPWPAGCVLLGPVSLLCLLAPASSQRKSALALFVPGSLKTCPDASSESHLWGNLNCALGYFFQLYIHKTENPVDSAASLNTSLKSLWACCGWVLYASGSN